MRAIQKLITVGLAAGFSVGALTARANLEVSAAVSVHATADFNAPLATSGVWVEAGSCGRCWRPAGVAFGWRPYCSGHWVWTDCGWYWASDEPWAWACYHYGGWVYDPVYAWVWVPGIEWAPAWVTWRIGPGYIGWAPVAPHGVMVPGSLFVFVKTARFESPVHPTTVIVNNTTLVSKSITLNNIQHETRKIGGAGSQEVIVNHGPALETIQKESGRQIKAVPIGEAARQARVPAGLAHGNGEAKSRDKTAVVPGEHTKSAPQHMAPAEGHFKPPAKSPSPDNKRQPPFCRPRQFTACTAGAGHRTGRQPQASGQKGRGRGS